MNKICDEPWLKEEPNSPAEAHKLVIHYTLLPRKDCIALKSEVNVINLRRDER
jgi:hypothetical protein